MRSSCRSSGTEAGGRWTGQTYCDVKVDVGEDDLSLEQTETEVLVGDGVIKERPEVVVDQVGGHPFLHHLRHLEVEPRHCRRPYDARSTTGQIRGRFDPVFPQLIDQSIEKSNIHSIDLVFVNLMHIMQDFATRTTRWRHLSDMILASIAT